MFGTASSAAADGVGALKSATKSDIEKSIRQPITFDNPKIRVGRKPEKKKV